MADRSVPVVSGETLVAQIDDAQRRCEDYEAALQPAGKQVAIDMADLLLGSYPRLQVDDIEVYTRAIVSVLAGYSKQIQVKAVQAVIQKCKFTPTSADITEACEAQAVPLRNARSRALRERKLLHGLREERAARDAVIRSQKEFLEKHDGKSPLEVLTEKGMVGGDATGENSNEENGDESADGLRASGQSGGSAVNTGRGGDDRRLEGGDRGSRGGSDRYDGKDWGSRIPREWLSVGFRNGNHERNDGNEAEGEGE